MTKHNKGMVEYIGQNDQLIEKLHKTDKRFQELEIQWLQAKETENHDKLDIISSEMFQTWKVIYI